MGKIAVYLRDGEDVGIGNGDLQLLAIKSCFLKDKDPSTYTIFYDKNYEGEDSNRPDYNKMIKNISEYDTIISVYPCILHTHVLNWLNLESICFSHRVLIRFTVEAFDMTNSQGRFMAHLFVSTFEFIRTYKDELKRMGDTIHGSPALI